MRTAVMVGLAAVMLASCAQIVWDKPGGTPQGFNTDSYECERDARQSGYYGGGLIGALSFKSFEERCMQARGWTKRG
jgi:hypothetical protein